MNTVADRIRQLRKHFRLTQTAFGHLADRSKVAVSRWEQGLDEPGWDSLHALQQSKQVNPKWVKYGEEPMFLEVLTQAISLPPLNPQISMKATTIHFSNHRGLGDGVAQAGDGVSGTQDGAIAVPRSSAVIEQDGAGAGGVSNVVAQPVKSGRRIPLLRHIPAGPWKELVENNNEAVEEWLTVSTEYGELTYAWRAEGDSMVGEGGMSFPPGTILYINPEEPCQPGDMVIARLTSSGEAVFKKLAVDAGKRFLVSLNRNYPPITEPFEVIGVVEDAKIKVKLR